MHLPVNKEPEWIELLNFQNYKIDSIKLEISDPKGKYPFVLRDILPYQYIILVKDTNLIKKYRVIPDSSKLVQTKIPSLNNTGDSLILKNDKGEIIDYFYFSKDFGITGISLERLEPYKSADNKENLKPSMALDSATCGKINSQSFQPKDTLSKNDEILIEPNPFSPNSIKNKCIIKIQTMDYAKNLEVKIYDTNGALVKNLTENQNFAKFSKIQIQWDGTNSQNQIVQVGAYPVIIEYDLENSSTKIMHKKIIVVGN